MLELAPSNLNMGDKENESCLINKLFSKIEFYKITFFSAIIRYLGSRFPETVCAVDDENRSSLHYAATLKDNGHFYNLLVTLGADSKALDNVKKCEVNFIIVKTCQLFLTAWKISRFLFKS